MVASGEWLARKLLELEQQVQALSRGTRLGNSSLQGESILALDEDGEVLAELGTDGGAGGVLHLDGPVPPRPTAPVLEQGVGTIFVRWDGAWDPIDEGDEGEQPTTPLDFDRIEVHATTDPEATEWDEDTLVGSITQRTGGVVMIRGWDIDDVVYVRLVCRSLADKLSEPSEPAEVTVTGIDIAAIVDELDAANVELSNLDGTMFAVGAELDALEITFKNLDTSVINTDDGTLAEALDDARQALEDARAEAKNYTDSAASDLSTEIEAARAEIEGDLEVVRQSADGKSKITWSTSAPSGAGKSGDTWFRMSGNNIIGHWRHSGSAWVSMSLSATVIPNLDAGKITSGYIDTARLAAGSITADKVLVGGQANLFPDQDLVYPGGYGSWSVVDGGLERNGSGGQSGSYWTHTKFEAVPGERIVGSFTQELDTPGSTTVYISWQKEPGGPWVSPRQVVNVSGAGENTDSTFTPADALWGRIGLYVQSSVPAGVRKRVTGIRVRRMTGATLIEDGAITTGKIASDAITSDKISANAIGARAIAADAVEAGKIAAKSISGREIIANVIKAEHIAAFTITAGELAANSVSTDKLVANSVIADKIAANAITAGKIDALAVTADKLAANAVTADKIAANAITAGKIDSEAINGMVITGATVRTAAEGTRVELNPSGIHAWDPDGVETFNLAQATGQIEAIGKFYSGKPGQQRVLIDDALFNSESAIIDDNGNPIAAGGAGILFGFEGQAGRSATIGYVSRPSGLFETNQLVLRSPRDIQGESSLSLGNGTAELSSNNGLGKLSRVRLTSTGVWQYSASTVIGRSVHTGGGANWSHEFSTGGAPQGAIGSPPELGSGTFGVVAQDGRKLGLMGDPGVTITTSNDLTLSYNRLRATNMNTGSGTDLIITSANYIGKKSSSRRYKIAEEPLERTMPDITEALLNMPVKTWFDRQAAERIADAATARTVGVDTTDDLADVDPLRRIPGVVAEDLDAAGLGMFVVYNPDGTPESVMYDRLGVALIPVIKGMKEQIDRLEAANGIGE